jgi:hypothetical protein
MKRRLFVVFLSLLLLALIIQSPGCQPQPVTSVSTAVTITFSTTSPATSSPATVPSTTAPPISTTGPSPTGTPLPPTVLPNGSNYFTKWGYETERFKDTTAFDAKYNSTIFQVRGKITGIDLKQGFLVVDDNSVPATLAYDSAWQCFFATDLDIEPNVGQIMDLKVGQSVTVQGAWGFRVIGKLPTDPVYLGNCALIGVS